MVRRRFSLPILQVLLLVGYPTFAVAADSPKSSGAGKILLQDDFERDESDPNQEQVGGGWGTNSKTRAKGNKQVDLDSGAIHVTRHAIADHGVSVFHDVQFRDATIQLRFKLGPQDDLGINIADMKEKSVHAGHICVARIRPNRVDISDLKTGNMHLPIRTARKEGKLTGEQKKMLAGKTKQFKVDLSPDEWHQLSVRIAGDTMSVDIDGQRVGQFSSPGIAHPTKRRLRLAVNRSAWIDDVTIRDGA